MDAKEYLKDPCRASSLPFYKVASFALPDHIRVCREDELAELPRDMTDEPYFKLIHWLKTVPRTHLASEYVLTFADTDELSAHIESCYDLERLSVSELALYKEKPVYSEDLWLAIRDRATNEIVASGIGEFDSRIGEGILDWIQVSPSYRGRGLGKCMVCELLRRLQGKAGFVTVSGRVNNSTNPRALYRSCGFTDQVIWHVVKPD